MRSVASTSAESQTGAEENKLCWSEEGTETCHAVPFHSTFNETRYSSWAPPTKVSASSWATTCPVSVVYCHVERTGTTISQAESPGTVGSALGHCTSVALQNKRQSNPLRLHVSPSAHGAP